MNATCPSCETVYRIDPAKVPEEGVRARCARCDAVFPVAVAREEPDLVETFAALATEPAAAPDPELVVPASPPAPPPAFGVSDPEGRARRLARALISDIVVYHPERRDESLKRGTLRNDFRDEIRKSWDEYVAQVGETVARESPYFREALNDILAGGERVF